MRPRATSRQMLWLFALTLTVIAAASAQPDENDDDVVVRRGALEPIRGTIILVNDAGVTIRSSDSIGASHLVTWDRVRDVRMRTPDPALDERLVMAEDIWRARSRLERGDAALAEPIFERLFNEHLGRTDETALIVAEGLLRCRLYRLANDLAVIPALEVIRLRRADVRTDRYRMMQPVYDEMFELCPLLPPVWLDSSRLVRLESDLERYEAHGDEVVAAFASLYQHALRVMHDVDGEPGRIVDEIRPARQHAGVRLMRDLITLIDPAADGTDRRRAAESRLMRQVDEEQPWIEAWLHYFEGLALIDAEGAGRNERGIASLAHLPARFAQSQTYLAGLAMHRMIMHLEANGRADAAASMREELARRFPQHPATTGER